MYERLTRSAILGLIVLVAIIAIPWFATRPADRLPQTYRNSTYGFSLRLPADYTVTEAPNTNVKGENAIAATKSHGLGLGLTICSTIVQAHGGKLTLANDDGDRQERS